MPRQLYEMARVSDGESLSDPAGFAGRLTRALTKLRREGDL